MKATLVLLVLALLALAAIAIAAEPTPAVRQLATSTADEPVAMILSGAALLAFASALKRAG